MHDQRVGGRDVETRLHDRGRQQDIVLAVVERRHDVLDHGRRHLAVRHRDLHLGHVLVEEVLHLGEIVDARADIERLAAAIALAQQRLADHQRIVWRHKGAYREAIDRGRCDDRQVAHARQCQLQRARDRRRAQGQHMDLGAELLQPLLVRDAEMLLLVHDQQAEVLELDRLAEQRVGADDDIDRAIRQTFFGLVQFLRRDQPRRLCDIHRKAAEALGEIFRMLARQQRGRHHHRDLLALHRHRKGRAQRHLGLAEADIAADQAIHRLAALEVVQRRVDRGELILGFLVGKARAEFVVNTRLYRQLRRFVQMPLGRDLDEFAGDLANPVLQLRLARLPPRAAELVEFDMRMIGAVARQQLDILDRQEELGLVGVAQLETVVRRARDIDGLQADEAADTVLDMDDDVAGRQARDLRDEVFELAAGLARPHQAIAEDILLGQHGKSVGLEPGLHADDREHGLVARHRLHHPPRIHVGEIVKLVIGQHAGHALARAFAPQRHHHLPARGLQPLHMRHDRLEHVDRTVGPLGREVAPLAGADIDDGLAVRHRERGQPRQRNIRQPVLEFGLRQVKPIGRQRLVDHAAAGMLQRLAAGLIVVLDLLETLARGVLALRLDSDRRVAQIVEHRLEAVVKQRQPVLHAGMAAAFAHRLVERIVALRRAEFGDISHAEAADGFGDELEFGDRHEIEATHRQQCALGLGIEAADRLQRVAKEIETHRLVETGRKQIEDAAAHRIFARLAHGRGAVVAVVRQPGDDGLHRHDIAGRHR